MLIILGILLFICFVFSQIYLFYDNKQQIDYLIQSYNTLSDQDKQAIDAYNKLDQNVQSLQNLIEQQDIKNLQPTLQSLQQSLSTITDQYTKTTKKQDDIILINNTYKSVINDLIQKYQKSQQNINQQIQAMNQLKSNVSAIPGQLQGSLTDLQKKYQNSADSLTDLNKKQQNNVDSINKLNDLQAKIQNKLTTLDSIQSTLQNQPSSKNITDIQNQLQQAITDAQQKYTPQQTTMTLQQSVRDIQQQLQNSQTDTSTKMTALQNFQNSIQSLNPTQINSMMNQIPTLQKNISDLQTSLNQIQQQNQTVTQLQQQQNQIAAKFIQINASGTDPSKNGLYVIGQDDNSNAIIAARVTQNSKGKAFTSYDHAGVTGWSAGVDANDQNKYKIAPHWDDPGADTALTINNLATQKNRNVGIGTTDPQADLHVNGRILANGNIDSGGQIHASDRIYNDKGNIDSAGDMNANYIGSRKGIGSPWISLNGGANGVLAMNATGQGNPDTDGIKVWADAGKDATVALRAAQGSKNNPGITFDRANTASWRVGINQDNEFRVANSWNDTNANPAIKVQNNRDWMTLFANHVNICNPAGQNCRTIYG